MQDREPYLTVSVNCLLSVIEAQERATQQRITELEKSSEWFQERLGLKFKKTSGGCMFLGWFLEACKFLVNYLGSTAAPI